MAELVAAVETRSGRKNVFVRTVRTDSLTLMGVVGERSFCAGQPAMMRVDGKKAVTLERGPNGVGALEGAAAEELARQMRAGTSALVRVHISPGCVEHDFRITLRGYTTAWNRLSEELRQDDTSGAAETDLDKMIDEIDAEERLRRFNEPAGSYDSKERQEMQKLIEAGN